MTESNMAIWIDQRCICVAIVCNLHNSAEIQLIVSQYNYHSPESYFLLFNNKQNLDFANYGK